MSGEIRDFRKQGVVRPGPKILGQNELGDAPLQRPNESPTSSEAGVEVVVHEEVVREGDNQVRVRKDDDGIEIRYREGASQADWEKAKRSDDL